MHAIQIEGGRLLWAPTATPVPGPGEVRIRVVAAGVNRADLVQRAGAYPAPTGASPILGLEVAGEVDAVGEGAGWSVGDRVCALLAGGGYAEQVVVDGRLCLPVPDGIAMTEAAGLVEVWATVWLNLVALGQLAAGERVLVHAGASGVGTAALQLCRLRGARSFVTVGSEDKLAICRSFGAEGGAVRHAGPWVEAVRAWAGEVDLVLDPVGAGYVEQGQQVLAADGRLILIGLMGGREATIDLGRLLMKRQRLIGSTLRALPIERKAAVIAGLRESVWPPVASGEVVAVVEAVIPVAEADRAHALLAGNTTVGKVVLAVADEEGA